MPRWLSFSLSPVRAPRARLALALLGLFGTGAWTAAQESQPAGNEDRVVSYPPVFFDRYQPNTAFDMVSQVPGFQLDDGNDQRGFGGAVGNVLINDRYPSSKQDTPSQILQRIPVTQVERIELIRGQVRDIDLLGRPVVLNLLLVENSAAATRWELSLRKNFQMSPLAPSGSISVSDRWRSMTYNVGVEGRRASFGNPGTRDVLDASGARVEQRLEDHEGSGFNANSYVTAAIDIGRTSLQINATLGLEERKEVLQTINVPEAPGGLPTNDHLVDERYNRQIEIGINAERRLSEDLVGTAILLHHELHQEPSSSQRRFDSAGDQYLFRLAETEAETTETIARTEFVWSKFTNHVLQVNVEGARNILNSALEQVVDTGSGPELVPVPGANSRVEELRGDILVIDTWSLGKYEFDYGIGAESSTISQSGDADQKRRFSFVKPQAAVTYASSPEQRIRLRLAREVAQLDFRDFVSATRFEDNDLALGNPDLRPESTWIAEVSSEWRWGDLSVLRAKVFHHWISDVQDLLPLDDAFEVPGNIGDGRRWGLEIEATVPLNWLGLSAARLDIRGRLQDSTVEDPVTGRMRVLSAAGGHKGDVDFRDENRYGLQLDFRQDLDTSRVSWGWNLAIRAERPLHKVNELDVYDEGANVDAFIETTRWLGLKVRLTGVNLLDIVDSRDRTLYGGARELSPVVSREHRRLTNGRRLLLTLSGTF